MIKAIETTKRAAGYIRVSTRDQDENGVSMDAQRTKIIIHSRCHRQQGFYRQACFGPGREPCPLRRQMMVHRIANFQEVFFLGDSYQQRQQSLLDCIDIYRVRIEFGTDQDAVPMMYCQLGSIVPRRKPDDVIQLGAVPPD